MNDILSGLNERQIEAVTSTEGYLRVIAGAGSGKTKLLVSRYAYLVREYGISPANILCVTFTNKAAGEMKRRIRTLVGGEYDTSLISTYHGFCVRVLREDIERVFYPREFEIIDKPRQKTILGEIYRRHELKLDHASFEKMLDMIAEYKAENRSYVSRMCARDGRPVIDSPSSLNEQIIGEYMEAERRVYAMDFSDLLYFTLDVFARCPDTLEKWRDRLNYIEVDEFQDSSRTEMELVDLISAKYKNVMIVGDPDQNIYEWRGSDVRLLVDFDKTHAPTKTVILDRNYRSTPEILRCANSLIEKNVLRLKKSLYTGRGSGEPVIHYHEKSEYAEAGRIVENILDGRRHGRRFRDFAVLYRSGFLSRVIEKKLNENGIPYEIFGGVKFFCRMEILDVTAYLRLVAAGIPARGEDEIKAENDAFRRVVNTPRRKFGRSRTAHLASLAGDGSLYETLRQNLDDPAFSGSGAADFVRVIDSARESADGARISEIVSGVLTGSGYEQYIRELGDMERFENLSEFKRIAEEYERSFGEDITLGEFVRQLDIQASDSDGEDERSDTVKLMTIHSAKGLEFPVVFVPGFSEGIFPSAKTIEERRGLGLEEERRLCYVAITRAEERLFLLDSEGTTGSGRTKTPSRFLFEIGEENYTRIGAIPKELRDASSRAVSGEAETACSHTVGDTVTHPAFGDGVIESRDERRRTFRVRFPKLGGTRDIAEDFFTRGRRAEVTGSKEPSAAVKSGGPEIAAAEKSAASSVSPAASAESAIINGAPSTAAPVNVTDAKTSIAEDARRAIEAVAEAGHRAAEEAAAASVSAPRENSMRALEEELRAAVAARRAELALRGGETENDLSDLFSAPDETLELDDSLFSDETADDDDSDDSDDNDDDDSDGGAFIFAERAEARSAHDASDAGISGDTIPLFDIAPEPPGSARGSANLWLDPAVPKTGWTCTGVTDLGSPSGICGMCGHQIIRYVHHMTHPRFRPLGVGCVCAGKMEGDPERARARERDFKNREARRSKFLARKWRVSKNGNKYLKIKEHIMVLYEDKQRGVWKYSFDGVFCRESFGDRDRAVCALFDRLEDAARK